MKKLLALSLLPILILSGCGAKSNKIQTPQPQQQVQQQDDDDEEMSWFEDEVLDIDDWGESKHKKTKPKTEVSKPSATSKPSTSTKTTTPKSTSSNKSKSTSKK